MAQQRFLLDTNILIYALLASRRLDAETRVLLGDQENTVYFSTASIWEIAIKSCLNKADFAITAEKIFALAIETGFIELTVMSIHTFAVAHMPLHHRDPFDRLLIAQAQSLPAYLLTSDGALSQYSDNVRLIAIK